MKFRLIAIDLDGTLLDSRKHISVENKEAILYAMDRGVKVVICSGRIFAGARTFARMSGVTEPIIACNGAIIKDPVTEEILYHDYMQVEDCRKVVEICHGEDIYFHVYIGDTMYAERLEFSSAFYWEKNKTLPDSEKVSIELVDRMEWILDRFPDAVGKIVVVSENPEILGRARREVEKIKTVEVTSSEFKNFEVMNAGVNKGKALKILAQKLGIPKEEVIAIGDNENDFSMFDFAGLKVAMANGEKSIKDAADFITVSNDEHGVAAVIRKFVS